MKLFAILALLIIQALCQTTYAIRRLANKLESMDPARIVSGDGFDLYIYLENAEEDGSDVPFPLLLQRLKSIPEIVIEKKNKIYRIKPFEFIEVTSEEGKKCLGKFHEIVNTNNEIIITYTNAQGYKEASEIYAKSTVIFSPSDEDDKIERIYSGWSESCVLRVSLPKLNIKHRKRTLSLYVDYKGRLEETDNEEENDKKDLVSEENVQIGDENGSVSFGNNKKFKRFGSRQRFGYSSSGDFNDNLEIKKEIGIFENPENNESEEEKEGEREAVDTDLAVPEEKNDHWEQNEEEGPGKYLSEDQVSEISDSFDTQEHEEKEL